MYFIHEATGLQQLLSKALNHQKEGNILAYFGVF